MPMQLLERLSCAQLPMDIDEDRAGRANLNTLQSG